MAQNNKAFAIITNHFKELPVNPKVVYANKCFLNLLGMTLEEIGDKDPSFIFNSWNKDQFIQEIVTCVEQKINWVGDLNVSTKAGSIVKRFTITPVYNIGGEISYYSCSTDVEADSCVTNIEPNACLDTYVAFMAGFYEHFQEVCKKTPASLVRIDLTGKIVYANLDAQKQFKLDTNMNLFGMLEEDSPRVIKFFNDKKVPGKVSKIDFNIFINNENKSVQCKFWPLFDDQNINIIGYSMMLIDQTKQKDITRELIALKGV